jgi:hypothetical protein
MAVKMSMLVFLVVMTRRSVGRYQHFGEKYCLHLWPRRLHQHNTCTLEALHIKILHLVLEITDGKLQPATEFVTSV